MEGQGVRAGIRIGNRYELIEEAGKGGMSTVWRGVVCGDAGFSRTVAIKHMHPPLAVHRQYVDMFVEEARVGAALAHTNVAQTYDFVEEHGQYFLVLEWVEGIDLGTYLRYQTGRGERTDWDLVLAVAIGMLRALTAAHERIAGGLPSPIVHRDVSPHNVLLSERGEVKLTDFGLALAKDRTGNLTEPGVVKGKMSYLCPQVVLGHRPTVFSDQFAAGSVLWEMLVGRRLFAGESDFDVYNKVKDAQVQPLRPLRSDIPRPLVRAVHKALSQQPQDRFASVREMADELSHILQRAKPRRELHGILSQAVLDARKEMGMGRRTGHPDEMTPVADFGSHTGLRAPTSDGHSVEHRLPASGS